MKCQISFACSDERGAWNECDHRCALAFQCNGKLSCALAVHCIGMSGANAKEVVDD